MLLKQLFVGYPLEDAAATLRCACRPFARWLTLAYVGTLIACGNLADLAGSPEFPSGTQDPSTFKTPDGARRMFRGAQYGFQQALADYIMIAGVLSDELQSTGSRGGVFSNAEVGGRTLNVDMRQAAAHDELYAALQQVRTLGVQANGALLKYDPASPRWLRGEVYAWMGYAELLLAELYCSGVPLSQLEFEGDYKYKPGSTSREVYQHALTLFDSARALASDDASVRMLAQVGAGRTLVELGAYDKAAAAVEGVPDDFTYGFPVVFRPLEGSTMGLGSMPMVNSRLAAASVSDGEGGTGLAYRSSGDPRTMTTAITVFLPGSTPGMQTSVTVWFPSKYGNPGTTSSLQGMALVTVASGVEARLIEAEAALHADSALGGTRWLDILNQLRATATVPGMTGLLPPLADPGAGLEAPVAWTARIDTLFAERAAWLFVTGHRQGDMRRLVRAQMDGGYGRPQRTVYPTGPYPNGHTSYGDEVNLDIGAAEAPNKLFIGCYNRRA